MNALRDVRQLLRIAEQDEVARGRAHRDGIGERHLAGLVDEQVVERAGPSPARANSHDVPATSCASPTLALRRCPSVSR